jgi:hypothetical protein
MQELDMNELLSIEGISECYPRWALIEAAKRGAQIEFWPIYNGTRRSYRRYGQIAKYFDMPGKNYYVDTQNRPSVRGILQNVYAQKLANEALETSPIVNQPIQVPMTEEPKKKQMSAQQKRNLKRRSGIQSAHHQIKNSIKHVKRRLNGLDLMMQLEISRATTMNRKFTIKMVELEEQTKNCEKRLAELELTRDVLNSFLKG